MIEKIVNSYLDEEIEKSKKRSTKLYRKEHKRIFSLFLNFCKKRSIDPLKVTTNEIVTFIFIHVHDWRNRTAQDYTYFLKKIYEAVIVKRSKLADESILLEFEKAINIATKRRDSIKQYKYFPMIGNKTALSFLSELTLEHSILIFHLYKCGLVYKDIINFKFEQIKEDIECFVLRHKIYHLAAYRGRIKIHRLLKYDQSTKEALYNYMKSVELDIEKIQEYGDKLVFERVKNSDFMFELTYVAKKFGFSAGISFLNELRHLMITRLHRRNAPIGVKMDFMKINKHDIYVNEVKDGHLDCVDTDVIERSMTEAFDLTRF